MQAAPIALRVSATLLLVSSLVCSAVSGEAPPALESGRVNPPVSARLRAYWWWLNGNVTKAALTRDLEEMKAKGWGGALICDADGASQDGNDPVKHGPTFLTPERRELYQHALREADRLGLEMSLNVQSGWNLGGPMVTAEDAAKKLVWSETRLTGPAQVEAKLPEPKSRDGYYRDLYVVTYRLETGARPLARRPLDHWEQKAMHKALHFSAPDTTPLLEERPGDWQVLRFGCTIRDHSKVSTSSDGWKGFALEVLDAGAFQR